MEPLIILGLAMGMRHGEICALRWNDISFEEHTLRIERTVSYISTHGYIVGEPKTENSKRTIALPRFVIQFLERHRLYQLEMRKAAGSQWQNMDLVFCGLTGGYRSPSANGRCFERLLARAGLPRMCVHELRHNAATLLAARMNMPANMVQELLGHDDIETTLGLYTHSDLDMQRKMMNDLDEFWGIWVNSVWRRCIMISWQCSPVFWSPTYIYFPSNAQLWKELLLHVSRGEVRKEGEQIHHR